MPRPIYLRVPRDKVFYFVVEAIVFSKKKEECMKRCVTVNAVFTKGSGAKSGR